jgi:hypothetical protein
MGVSVRKRKSGECWSNNVKTQGEAVDPHFLCVNGEKRELKSRRGRVSGMAGGLGLLCLGRSRYVRRGKVRGESFPAMTFRGKKIWERETNGCLGPSGTGMSSNGMGILEGSVGKGMGPSLGGRDVPCTTDLVSSRGWEDSPGEKEVEEGPGGGPREKPGEDPASGP